MEKILLFFLLSCYVHSHDLSSCANTWSEYQPSSGDFSSIPVQFDFAPAEIFVRRSIEFRCVSGGVQFRTTETLERRTDNGIFIPVTCVSFGLDPCTGNCDSKMNNITILCATPFGFPVTSRLLYKNRNCNKLYWSSWNELSNCSTFNVAAFERKCLDCEGNIFPFLQFCNRGRLMYEECLPFWGEWGEVGECTSSNCNSTGQRFRIRSCFYANGSEAIDSQVCVNGSEILTEQCSVNKTGCVERNSALEASAGVAAGLAFVFVLIAAVALLKSPQNDYTSKNKKDDSVQVERIKSQSTEVTNTERAYSTTAVSVHAAAESSPELKTSQSKH